MKIEQQFEACAKLEGWIFYPSKDNGFGQARPEFWQNEDTGEQIWEDTPKFKDYNSYDTLIPLIVKWCGDSHDRWKNYIDILFGSDVLTYPTWIKFISEIFKKTPQQLREALLRAAGEWKE